MQPRQIVSGYFLLQALCVAAWWTLLLTYPESRKWFQPREWPEAMLLSYWLADLSLIAGGSAICAYAVRLRREWATTVVWVIAVVCWYPTLVCIGTSSMTGEAWIASALMTSMSGLSLAMATIHGKRSDVPATFRVTAMKRRHAVLSTIGQIVIFWGTFLWVLPMGIFETQRKLGWNPFEHALQLPLAVLLFSVASLLGLWSGISMATLGGGTPLPTATAPQLVIRGPYRYVRNPMAVAGILQGISVGWLLGSIPVIAYSLAGIFVWHIFVRPAEERDLRERFGDDYDDYRSEVRLWMPKLGRQKT